MNKTIFTPQRTQSGWDLNRLNKTGKCILIDNKHTVGLNWKLEDFDIVSYACGDKLDVNHNLTFDHFEYAYPMKTSSNELDKRVFHHFLCTVGTQETFVVAKKK